MWYNDVMHIDEFQQWLKDELDKRYWTYNELARQADLSSAYVSMVMTGQRNPGEKFCTGVAKALNLPISDVFRRAGILPAKPPADSLAETALHLFRLLSEQDQDRLLAMMRALVELEEAKGRARGGGPK